jgi:DNA-binding MarR family transcriptional regulator
VDDTVSQLERCSACQISRQIPRSEHDSFDLGVHILNDILDIDPDTNAASIALANELALIAKRLSSLANGPDHAKKSQLQHREPTQPLSLGRIADRLYRDRRARTKCFAPELFADPAWDILLDLFRAHQSKREISMSSLCIAADVPATTALRWIKALECQGMIKRSDDPSDGRKTLVQLTEAAELAMRDYVLQFAESWNIPVQAGRA